MHDPIQHAKSYPFPAPPHCYLYEAGEWRRLEDHGFDRDGRVPVLAAGSNQSPEQLARKYGQMQGIGAIHAQRGRLHDFDVVYAAHLAGYGSVPATFQHSPGTAVTVFVLWLTEPQLIRMHETEGNYSYDHLTEVRVDLDAGDRLTEAFAYTSKVGCLVHEEDCVGLAEIAADNRRFRAMGQTEILGVIRDRLDPGAELDRFIEAHVHDADLRRVRSRHLGEGAIPAAYPRRSLLIL